MDPHSTAPVVDFETVCRGGYDEYHVNGAKLKSAFIKEGDLRRDQLSFWRREKLPDPSYDGLMAHLRANGPAGTLRTPFGISAEVLRALTHPEHGRYLCVIDDTATGPGTFDLAHCVVRLCQNFPRDQLHIDWVKAELAGEFNDCPQV